MEDALSWTIEDWSGCPTDCGHDAGDNSEFRNVTCMASDGIASWTETDESNCPNKPNTERDCPGTDACGKTKIFFHLYSSIIEDELSQRQKKILTNRMIKDHF